MSHELNYEHAVCFVFDCDRGGADGFAEADIFRGAVRDDNWEEVAKGLSSCLEKIQQDAAAVPWGVEDFEAGGAGVNFVSRIDAVKERLLTVPRSNAELYAIISELVALSYAPLKATGGTTEEEQ